MEGAKARENDMPSARIIDETGRSGIWNDALREVLTSAGFGLEDPSEESAGLTVLLNNIGTVGHEADFRGDLLILTVPAGNGSDGSEPVRTEVMGSSRLKARHQLTEITAASGIADEIRPLVKLFIH